ncbi:hypothetical protein [Brevundimonas balnearis]|uniref:Uncharacterized protein n=1 Tax=Brevundimonas balnearis TaxID=1572858 RepID=A0ABV6R106_9CAUL
MGTLHVELVTMNTRAETGSTMPLAESQPVAQATLNTTTTSARVGTITGQSADLAWVFTAIGKDIWVRASGDAVANAAGPNQGFLVPAGASVARGVSEAGEQVAARDVA